MTHIDAEGRWNRLKVRLKALLVALGAACLLATPAVAKSNPPVPVDVAIFGGTNVDYLGFVTGDHGHDLDGDALLARTLASRATRRWNPSARVRLYQWGTYGDPSQQGVIAAENEERWLNAHTETHDVMVIGYSRGAYCADAYVKHLIRHSANVRNVLTIYVDPTGILPFDDGRIWPDEYGPGSKTRVHNITYHDGLHPYSKDFIFDEYPMPGEMRLAHPYGKTNGTDSHTAFLGWYMDGEANAPFLNDFLTLVHADNYMSGQIRNEYQWAGHDADADNLSPIYIPGGSPPPLIEAFKWLIDRGISEIEVLPEKIIKFAFDGHGHLIVVGLKTVTRYTGRVYDATTGELIKTFERDTASLADALADAVKHVWRWLKDFWPF